MAKYTKCSPKGLGISLAFVSGLYMLLLSLVGLTGRWTEAVATMAQFHAYYSLSFWGTVAGIIEAAIFGYIAGWLIAWAYNKYM